MLYFRASYTKVGMKVTSPTFILGKVVTAILTVDVSWVHPLQIWDNFSTKPPLITNPLFPRLCETLYDGRAKLFAQASDLFTHAHCVSTRRRPQNGVIGSSSFRGPKRWKSEGAKAGLQAGWEKNSRYRRLGLKFWDNDGMSLEKFLKSGATIQSDIWRH